MAKFFIKSIELRDYDVRHGCIVLEVVDKDKLLVELDRPIPGYVYNQVDDIKTIVLAPKYTGMVLVPVISEWPCIVNIYLPKEEENWRARPWRLLDIGELTEN